MTPLNFRHPAGSGMSNADFRRLSLFIYNNYGIKLPETKKTMLEGRLQKRLKALHISTYKEYCDYVFSVEGRQHELIHMIDVVTTNKTDFFREAIHFDFLRNDVLPCLERDITTKPLEIWSAGCSTGEEPYTLAMVLSDFKETAPAFNFNILGTDISTRVLKDALNAVYAEEKVIQVPLVYKKRYLLKSKDTINRTVRINPELRAKVNFKRLNFIDGDVSNYPEFNIIFCRNVLIYFDRPTQEKVILKLCSKLQTGGFLFLGHSESIASMTLPLQQVKPTIYKKI